MLVSNRCRVVVHFALRVVVVTISTIQSQPRCPMRHTRAAQMVLEV
jgi:hypothetical protein